MLQRILSGERDRALPDAYFFCSDICDVLFARGFNTEGQGTGDEGKGKRVKGEGRREKREEIWGNSLNTDLQSKTHNTQHTTHNP